MRNILMISFLLTVSCGAEPVAPPFAGDGGVPATENEELEERFPLFSNVSELREADCLEVILAACEENDLGEVECENVLQEKCGVEDGEPPKDAGLVEDCLRQGKGHCRHHDNGHGHNDHDH